MPTYREGEASHSSHKQYREGISQLYQQVRETGKMDWQVGDRVQIVGVSSSIRGSIGTIADIVDGNSYPMMVQMDDEKGIWAFKRKELSLIEDEMSKERFIDEEELTDDRGRMDGFDSDQMREDMYTGDSFKGLDDRNFHDELDDADDFIMQKGKYAEGVTVYISGPMTGKPQANYPLFNQVAEDLIGRVIEVNGERRPIKSVLNPAELDEEKGLDGEKWQSLLLRDVNAMIERNVEAVVVFDDWWNSRGSTAEAYFGRTFGWPVYEYDVDEGTLNADVDFSVTFEAQDIVLGARRYDYGHPLDNFVRIARMWNALLYDKLSEPLDVRDVAMMMIDMKQAREYNTPKRDNIVDVVGYATAYAEAIREADHRGQDIGDLMSDYIRQMRSNTLVEGQENVTN